MANTVKKLGDDVTLSVTVGTAVDIDALAELFVYVVNDKTEEVLEKFSKAGAGAFTALVRISATVYEARVLSGTTKDARAGKYRIEGNVAQTDAGYESSEENTITLDDTFTLVSNTSKASSSG